MRVSVIKDSPAFHEGAARARYFLDGAPVQRVVQADDAEGWLEVAPQNPARDEQGRAEVIRMSGKVKIELP